MKIKGKNGIKFNVDVNKNCNHFTIKIVSDNGETMGGIIFGIKINKTFLYKVETKEKFQHLGVGKALLELCEYFTISYRINKIEGKYYPTNEYAKPMYEKNGYVIYKDYYDWFVEKRIENMKERFNELKEKIIEDYESTVS